MPLSGSASKSAGDSPAEISAPFAVPALTWMAKPPFERDKPVFLVDVHTLRAVAIVFIVASHCLQLFNWHDGSALGRWLQSLLPNGTVFFLFIAGLLFQHLSVRFDYLNYLKKKWRNVVFPYIVLSLPITVFQATYTHHGVFSPAYPYHHSSFALNVFWSLLTGFHTLAPFWFIPMISIFYLLAPVFIWLDRKQWIYRLLPVLLIMTTLVHRPANTDHIWQSLGYFAPVYMYGMWFSRNRERAIAWHQRWLVPLVVLVVALTTVEVVILKRPGFIASLGMFSVEQGIVDTNALQKLLLCGVLLVILRRAGHRVAGCLRNIGDLSFGIYFLHMVVIHGFSAARLGSRPGTLPLFCLSVGLTLVICVLILRCARHVFGPYSRSVVGC